MGEATEPARGHTHVVVTPGICGGRARIAGTRLPVWVVVAEIIRGGTSPDEFVDAYPQVSLAKVYGALSFYYDHRSQVDRDLREQEAAWRKRRRSR
jgi:uncharacterized protein (DUF433 family)